VIFYEEIKAGLVINVSRRTAGCTNESLCEDIIAPWRRCPRKLKFGRAKVGFALRPYPFFRRLAPCLPFVWLSCWTAKIAATLDTVARISQSGLILNVYGVLWGDLLWIARRSWVA
jgi:hypothetical protein